CTLWIGVSEEMSHAEGLVLGHQGWSLAGDPMRDLLELGKALVWREIDVVISEGVRPEHSAGDCRRDHGRLKAPAAFQDCGGSQKAGQDRGGGGRGESFCIDPGGSD